MKFLVLLPALIHIADFILEGFRWGRPFTNRLFRVRSSDVEATRIMAFQQGMSNLLLAAAVIAGWCLWMGVPSFTRGPFAGQVLMTYGLGSIMVGGLTLMASFPKLWWPAILQIVPAALALALVFTPGL